MNENSERCYPSAADFVDPIVRLYYPALLDSVHACLAVFGSMALAGRTKPLSLILETPSGYGKTAVVQMFFPSPDHRLDEYVYRSDKFTPKAFVSHAANKKRDELKRVDLLPKLRNKVLLTKELAPLFRGREEEMQDNFSILISVLDGKGLTSDTGMHGQRGYREDLLFNWIGATTPLPASVHRMMSQLGTRLLFYEVPAIPPTEDELIEYLEAEQASSAEADCHGAVETFVLEFFKVHPIASVRPESIQIAREESRQIARWAQFLVYARAEIKFEKEHSNWTPVAAMSPEGAWKVATYFKDLARGHALICGRSSIGASDLDLVAHVAISSIPGHLRPILQSLRFGSVNTTAVEQLCRVTPPTARNYLQQLELLGLVELEAVAKANQPHTANLASIYRWLER